MPGHDGEVCAVQEQLREQLERLAFRHILVRVDEAHVGAKEAFVLLGQEGRHERLVAREQVAKLPGTAHRTHGLGRAAHQPFGQSWHARPSLGQRFTVANASEATSK